MTYVRRAVEGDVDALLPLCRAFHAESPVHAPNDFVEEKVGQLILDAMANPDWLAMVACDGEGAIVGMLMLYCLPNFYSYTLEVGDLTFYVVPEARGTRAAWLMMAETLKFAEQKGAAAVQLAANTGINADQAERFFARFGFERSGVVMRRTIAPTA